METHGTYFTVLQALKGNSTAIDQEKRRLEQLIQEIGSILKARLTSVTVPGLLWDLAFREIGRMGPRIGEPVSDFAGHARFLRSLCAAVTFCTVKPSEDPKTDELLALCGQLWSAMFHREMLDDLKTPAAPTEARHKYAMASLTSLLNAVQGELTYTEQVEQRVHRLFTPFSAEIIEPAIGLTTEEVIRGFQKVRSTLADRWNRAVDLSQPMVDRWKEYGRRYDASASAEELGQFMYAPETTEAGKLLKSSFDILEHLLRFTPQNLVPELGDRSKPFLEAFSFRPGEVNQKLGSPNDEDEVRRRPFARISDDCYALLDVSYSSFAAPRRLLECFDTDRKRQRLNKRRDDVLEDDAAKLFEQVVQPDLMLRNYYLPVGEDGQLAERDLLLLKGSCLILVESKARPLRSVKGRNDKLIRIASDVERSIQEGYDQACDVIRYIRSAPSPVPLFDSGKPNRKQVAELGGTNITTVLPVVFLDAYYGLIAADLKPWLKVDESVGFPWAVNRDTFESITLKIDTFERLREFLLWRRTLHGIAHNEDEAVFAGFYVQHGPFTFPKGADAVHLTPNYADVFEAEYFRRQGVPVEAPPESVGPPVWSKMFRRGDHLLFEVNGKVIDSINLMTGETPSARESPEPTRRERSVRNSPCPCGSGRKFKKCCLRS
jgi:hypothetical protein